jgi:hypothetical protein
MPARTKRLPFQVRLFNRRPSDREILADLQGVARRCGRRPFTFAVYQARGAFSTHTVAGRFGSWAAAVQAAGLRTQIDRDVPPATLLENLARVWRRLGRQPTGRDLVKRDGVSRYSVAAYQRSFGGWHQALLAFQDFSAGKPLARPALTRAKKARRAPRRRPDKRQINWRLRSRVLIRDNCQCRLCGTSPLKDAAVTLHVDHIVPWSKGGRTVLNNLQTLCARCNIGKGDWQKDRLQGDMPPHC